MMVNGVECRNALKIFLSEMEIYKYHRCRETSGKAITALKKVYAIQHIVVLIRKIPTLYLNGLLHGAKYSVPIKSGNYIVQKMAVE
jgi:hypothetical protein